MHRGSVEVNTKTKGSISIAAVLGVVVGWPSHDSYEVPVKARWPSLALL
jgi:hypothetical protein